MVHVTNELMDEIAAKDASIAWDKVASGSASQITTVKSKEDLLIILKDCLSGGKSFHIVLENLSLLDWLDDHFTGARESMGGQGQGLLPIRWLPWEPSLWSTPRCFLPSRKSSLRGG